MVCCQALANTIAGNDALASTHLPRFLESEASDKVILYVESYLQMIHSDLITP